MNSKRGVQDMQNDLKRSFCREKGKQIWLVNYEEDIEGMWEFSFDRKKIYNLWTDYWEMTDSERELFKKEHPIMAALKDPDVLVPEEDEEDEDDWVEPEYEYSD